MNKNTCLQLKEAQTTCKHLKVTASNPHTGGGISSQSHGLKSPIGGENNPEVGEEPVERGQITTSNPKHSAQTRSEAATTIRANPVLRVSQRGETLLTVSLLSVRPRRARLAEQILTRDTEPCAGTGMRRYAPATREAFTCERSWGSDRFITASPGVKSLQNNWFTLTQDFRRGEAFLPQPSSALLWTESLTKKKKKSQFQRRRRRSLPWKSYPKSAGAAPTHTLYPLCLRVSLRTATTQTLHKSRVGTKFRPRGESHTRSAPSVCQRRGSGVQGRTDCSTIALIEVKEAST